MIPRSLAALLILLAGVACEPVGHDRPLDPKAARTVSDAVAGALVRGDAKNLFFLLDQGFHTVVSNEADLEKFLGGMNDQFGKPTSFEYRHSLDSRRVDGTWNRVSRVLWYSVETTKHARGKYFLKVEIVSDGSGKRLVTSGFGLLTFESLPKFLR